MPPCPPVLVTCHEEEVPSFVEGELDRLYGGRYASMAHFRIHGLTVGSSTYVARRGGEVVTVLLFRRTRRVVTVLNEGIRIGREEAELFARHMFARYRTVGAVLFGSVETEAQDFAVPSQRYPYVEDTVLALPPTVQRYWEGLGARTRANLKNYLNKLRRDEPAFAFAVYERQDVDEQHVRAIIGLNRQRMRRKDKVSTIDAQEEESILRYVRERGFVGVATIAGRFCGGVLMYRLGRNFTLRILAHDPRYDSCHLGLVCTYLSICACIERGGEGQFYFGWGRDGYKYRLGGKPRQLSRLVLYRSRAQLLLRAGLAGRTMWAGLGFRARRWVLRMADQGDRPLAVCARQLIAAARWLRADARRRLLN